MTPTRLHDDLVDQHADQLTAPGQVVGMRVPFFLRDFAHWYLFDMPVSARTVKFALDGGKIGVYRFVRGEERWTTDDLKPVMVNP
jgi:hypothetical protein